MLESYFTIKGDGEHEIVIQKSRFIGHVKRTETEEEAQAFIQAIKKKHYQATHNCSAYMIGENNLIQKANDDGEPSGTAGVPMLDVLQKMDLKDTCVVVTRYFGGIKLGAGGLIRAYSSSTSEAIKHVGVVKRLLMKEVVVQANYSLLGKVENELRNNQHVIDKIDYADDVTFHVYVPIADTEDFQTWMTDLTNAQVKLSLGNERHMEIDVDLND